MDGSCTCSTGAGGGGAKTSSGCPILAGMGLNRTGSCCNGMGWSPGCLTDSCAVGMTDPPPGSRAAVMAHRCDIGSDTDLPFQCCPGMPARTICIPLLVAGTPSMHGLQGVRGVHGMCNGSSTCDSYTSCLCQHQRSLHDRGSRGRGLPDS